MQILSDPSFLCVYFFSYPALQRDIQPLKTGSLLSSVCTVIKVRLSLFCWLERRLQTGCDECWVTFAAGTAKSGGWFLSAAHGLHTAMVFAVLRDQGNRYPYGILSLILFSMLHVWTVVLWNCSHCLFIFASSYNQTLILGIFLLCTCLGCQERGGFLTD